MTDFCHLHLHTEYSVLDGVGTSKQYSYRAREAGQTHIAITNHGNIDGVLDHQKQCGISGVKPLAGCELYVVPDMYIKTKGEKRYHITVLVENQTGWKNLLKLLTIANLEGFYHRPRVDLETLQQHLEGLVILTGCSLSFLNMTVRGEGEFGWYEEACRVKWSGKEAIAFSVHPAHLAAILETSKTVQVADGRIAFSDNKFKHVVALEAMQ